MFLILRSGLENLVCLSRFFFHISPSFPLFSQWGITRRGSEGKKVEVHRFLLQLLHNGVIASEMSPSNKGFWSSCVSGTYLHCFLCITLTGLLSSHSKSLDLRAYNFPCGFPTHLSIHLKIVPLLNSLHLPIFHELCILC